MEDTRFNAMYNARAEESRFIGPVHALLAVNPKAVAVDAVNTLSSAFSQCFSRLRRVQFDEEHQRSLLSCHTTDEGFSYPDEAMLELRRRLRKGDMYTQRRPTFAQELEATYHRHKAMQLPSEHIPTRPITKRSTTPEATPLDNQELELHTVLSDTDKALNDILSTKFGYVDPPYDSTNDLRVEDDMRRLSVDELLAFQVPAPSSPEKTGGDTELSRDAVVLRQWLASIDSTRSFDYTGYARHFESQGFQTLEDLAQLDEHDVEQAMSEIGITKFAHRARIRKAVLRLHQETTSTSGPAAIPA